MLINHFELNINVLAKAVIFNIRVTYILFFAYFAFIFPDPISHSRNTTTVVFYRSAVFKCYGHVSQAEKLIKSLESFTSFWFSKTYVHFSAQSQLNKNLFLFEGVRNH